MVLFDELKATICPTFIEKEHQKDTFEIKDNLDLYTEDGAGEFP